MRCRSPRSASHRINGFVSEVHCPIMRPPPQRRNAEPFGHRLPLTNPPDSNPDQLALPDSVSTAWRPTPNNH